MRLLPRPFLAALALLSCLAQPALADTPVETATKDSLKEWVAFLRLPNITKRSTAEIRANADWIEDAFQRYGYTAQQLEDGETPMVYAAWPTQSPGRKTVLFYAHMDGQAVKPEEWDQESPFSPVLKTMADGAWTDLPLDRLLNGESDPDDRLFARSAADDKAPIMMLLAAMNALKAEGRGPAINIKILLDSHEEGGPPTLKDVVKRNADLLAADAVIMLDGPMHISNRPTVVYGHRGGAGFELTVFGARTELHSGHYGNYSPNPAQLLAALLATFKDECGRVTVAGFYDGVVFDDETKAAFASVPDDEAAINARLGIAQPDCVGLSYQEAINYPSFNIAGLKAADVGANRRTIIPEYATAAIGMRTVPATPPERLIALVRTHIEAQGYHLVDGEPTEEERMKYPRLASMKGGGGGKALQTPLGAPVGKWITASLKETFNAEPVRIPLMGGSVPTSGLLSLDAPIMLLPLVNADNNQHAANENMRVGNYYDGVRALHGLFLTPFETIPAD
ncbi:M20/M25/M40 family metallo-hydrolase [Hyphomonas oceanitis]|uniref:Peptidase dimerization domain-containing protein n=1 Tax=Hyphomonas oceanitis SCH89 TaxID=1280953 RepID=A0A059G4Z8_9PROT|nr:M20/M25/M40 family metallo-hydrolase [Hyphomonas oceanitis]KDA01675.1 peptidase dimerization domain-containing protein [Hyphomonas oceanitis SCH89]